MPEPRFARDEHQRIEAARPLSSEEVFEVVRRNGEEELERPGVSLAWSGLAAGMAMGFSVIAEASLHARLPADNDWASVVADAGYTLGFIVVVMSRLQLFTENTVTPVMPMCWKPSMWQFTRLLRIWGIVLSTNLLGAILFAAFVMKTGATSEEVRHEIMALGRHAADGNFIDTVTKGIGAGFLIAAMTWIIAGAASSRLLIVGIITYAVAICEFSHVVAGTAEMAALVFGGAMGVPEAALGFVLPALLGNMIGGTGLFALIAYGQIRHELKER